MSDDEAAFLRTIRTNPDADLPRLVYADWLDERGHQLRAEFLRAHIELERLTEDSPRRRELAFWCRAQLDTQPHLLFESPLQPRFARHGRGLIEAAEFWNADAGVIASAFHRAPLRRVWVYGLGQWYSSLLAVPADNCLHTLNLTGNRLTADELSRAGLPLFPHLKELVLTGCDLDDEAARVLCEHPAFQRLERIHVGGNPFSREARNRLRDRFGKRMTFIGERDPARLYPIQNGTALTVGQARDLTQLLLWPGGDATFQVAWFDFAGNLLATETHDADDDEYESVRASILADAGFQPATIRVKGFEFPDSIGIGDFPTELFGGLEEPQQRDQLSDSVQWEEWLTCRSFTWALGDDYGEQWLNRDGEVIST